MNDRFTGLMVEDSSAILIGLLAIIKSGNSIVPINPKFPDDRIRFIVEDCQIKTILTDKTNHARVHQVARDNTCLEHVICIDDIDFESEVESLETGDSLYARTCLSQPEQPCYVIYTSGSTGNPKGVPITHSNLVPLLSWFHDYFKLGEHIKVLQNLSYTFDFGIFELVTTLLAGGALYFFNRKELSDLNEYVDFIDRHQINTIHTTPSFFANVIDLGRSLASLKLLHFGGERLTRKIVEDVSCQVGEDCYIYNGYGPTETTINSAIFAMQVGTEHRIEVPDSIPIGKPSANNIIYILDAYRNLQPVGVVGELYIGGSGVARGYLNRPQLTGEKFSDNPYLAGDCMYRTGDLGRWLPDGNIEFLGRIDYQVKIRGFRIETGEIESWLLKYEGIKETVVIARDEQNEERYLCAYIVGVKRPVPSHTELCKFLSQNLPDYMIPSYFVFLDKIPLNPNGKVDRKALPVPELSGTDVEYTPPRNQLEEKLVHIWSEVLNVDYNLVGIDSNFFEIGGHSLRATLLISKIHKELDVRLNLAEIFKMSTIRELAPYIESAVEEKFVFIPEAEKKDYYPLSPAQKRFFIFQQLEPDSISYNLYETMEFTGRVVEEKMAQVFKRLMRRHESLRTSFVLKDGEPVQRVHKPADIAFAIERCDIGEAGEQEAGTDFVRAFNLSCAPLLRVGMKKIEKERYHLMVDMHHIICDGTSVGVFIRDFLSIYNGEMLPPLRLQYRDYVCWLNEKKKRDRDKADIVYDFEAELLELPTDYIRPAVQSFEGSTANFDIGNEEAARIYDFSLKEGSTLYMVLFTIFNIFLAKLSGEETIVVGSPIAGRQHADIGGIIGLFINTLVIESRPTPDKGFDQFLEEVKENALQAYENQEFQYDELVERIEMSRDTSRNPLFDVMFVLQNMEIPELEIPGLKITRNIQENRAAKFDMTLYCEEGNNTLHFTLEYCTKLFKRRTILRFIEYFKKILFAVLEEPQKRIGQIEFISADEKNQILYDFNDTAGDYLREKTIYRLFEEQAERTPAHIAATHSKEGDLTYRQLNERANRLARVLRERGVKSNRVVGIMLQRSVELIESIYAVLKAGGAYLPIDPGYPEKRILSMLEQSNAHMLLTGKDILDRKELAGILQESVIIDELAGSISDQPVDNLQPVSGPGDLIYVIFTSGSTGVPKGAGVYQRSFVNLVQWFVDDFALTADDSNLLMTSFSFDLTQKNFYAPLVLGGTLCIPSQNVFDPGEILRELEARKVTWINCTPSMFVQLIEFCKGDELKRMESLRYVYLGGEPISINMFMRWLESEHCYGEIVNTYGPTECTDISNSYRIKEPSRFLTEAVPIGKPIYNVKLYVCDRNLQLLPVGIAGELLIAGESVGIGYVNDRELTEKKFVKHSFVKGEPAQLLYRTGDLVKWLPDGNIVFIGRMDYQVKIRGFRIEIGEIESQLLKHEDIKEAVVLALDSKWGASGQGDKVLCAYIVTKAIRQKGNKAESVGAAPRGRPHGRGEGPSPETGVGISIGDLREYLSRTLPDYMIPDHFVHLAEIPLNPNGKLNRKALPIPQIVSQQEYTAPRNAMEKKLVEIWARVLGIEKEKIGIDNNFFALGGHSLRATDLIAAIHRELNAEIALKELFRNATVRGLAESIGRGEKSRYAEIEPVEQKEYYALSSAQKRLFLLHWMAPRDTGYNITAALTLSGAIDQERLADAFRRLISWHESFRTSFHTIDGEPMQRVNKTVDFAIEQYGTGSRQQAKAVITRFVRPFDLSCAPLMRAGLIEITAEEHILMIDMHHIVSDGTSMSVLIEDFTTFYSGGTRSDISIRYKDYAEWQNSPAIKDSLKKQEEYWLKTFTGKVPVLDLPLDFPRPALQSFAGHTITFAIDSEQTSRLHDLAKKEGATLFMVLLTLFNILLAKLSGQEEIVVGSPLAGRRHAQLHDVIGMFINTLPFKNYPANEKSVRQFLHEVKENALAVFENQEYPFEELVEKVDVNRDAGRNPLFDAVLALQNIDMSGLAETGTTIGGGLTLTPFDYESGTAKFDLTVVCQESPGDEKGGRKLHVAVEYCRRLFKEETIRRFVGYFKRLISLITTAPGIKISEIEIVSEVEKRKLLLDFNRLDEAFPADRAVHQLFAEQAARTPDRTAVAGADIQAGGQLFISYRALAESSGQTARGLMQGRVPGSSLVAIMVDRSPEMIIGILAILKSGSGYVPLNPRAPLSRNRFILADCAVGRLLTTYRLIDEGLLGSDLISNLDLEIIPIDAVVCRDERRSPGTEVGAQDVVPLQRLAYVIFTSGSTGFPKGVPINHTNLSPLLHWGYKHMRLNPTDRTLQNLSYYFDWSAWEIFIALTSGTSLHMIPEQVILSPDAQLRFIETHAITVLHITPTHFQALVNVAGSSALAGLKCLAIGAEKLTYDLVERTCASVSGDCRVFNMYGPTEATIMAAVLEIHRTDYREYKSLTSIPIGTTIANSDLFVLDRAMKVSPVNVVGELYIGGNGTAAGYLNNPELTAEKFVTAPAFSPQPQQNVPPGTDTPTFPTFHHSTIPVAQRSGDRLYRTGDLVRWLADGNIEFLGRLDHQVKIRGYRIELAEIENRLLEHEEIKEVAVIDRKRENGETYLCAYFVKEAIIQQGTSLPDFRQFLSHSLPDYMIPSYFIPLERMPLNPNRKIDRNGLPEPDGSAQELDWIPPRDDIEKRLADIWQEILFTKETSPAAKKIGIPSDFFELGGHSLKVLNLVNAIQKEFAAKIDFQDIFQFSTLGEVSDLIRRGETTVHEDIRVLPKREYYELSYTQKRLWLLNRFEPDSPAFNLGGRIELHETVAEDVIQKVLNRLLRRHESLRTCIKKVGGDPVQVIRPASDVTLKARPVDLSHLNGEALQQERQNRCVEETGRTFNLEASPLLRIALVKLSEQRFDLVFTMHHIISDGWSLEVLQREFLSVYEAVKHKKEYELKPLRIQYKDWAAWHNRLLSDKKKMAAAKTFWKSQLSGESAAPPLPYNRAKTDSTGNKSAGYRMVIPADICQSLRKIANEHKASIYMVLLTGFKLLLSRITGRQDILVGFPGAGRQHDDIKGVIGLFVNTLVLRSRISPKETFNDLLGRVQESMMQALGHQAFPLELICGELKIKYPEISTFFNMFTIEGIDKNELNDHESYHLEAVQDAKFDMVCYLSEYRNGVEIETHYKKELFKPITIEKMMQKYVKILSDIACDRQGVSKEQQKEQKRKIKRSHGGENPQ